MKRRISLLLILAMLFASVPHTAAAEGDVPSALRVGVSELYGDFSPFFSQTADDTAVVSLTQAYLLDADREGNPVTHGIEGEHRSYGGTEYVYYGIADCDVTENGDGSVDYLFRLRDDVRFADGEPLTVKDVLFSIYVLCDPLYNGGTFVSLPIEGLQEYREGVRSLYSLIVAAGRDNSRFSLWSKDVGDRFWRASDEAFRGLAQDIVDYCTDNGYPDVASAAAAWGFDINAGATVDEFASVIAEEYGDDFAAAISVESAGLGIDDLFPEYADYAYTPVKTGDSADSISGITGIDDHSFNIHMTSVDCTAIYNLCIPVAPMHYYGDASQYNGTDNFGFPKGDISMILAKNSEPMGAGPYSFESLKSGILTLSKNGYYYRGTPKTDVVQFIEGAYSPEDIEAGVVDLIDNASLNTYAVDYLKSCNGGTMSGDVITTVTTDNLGYGYIGMCANVMNVGGDPGSAASKALRKAFATVFSVYRDVAIDEYYGERAAVIQYPISNTSWAAPHPGDEGYREAFSTDVEGNDIYTPGMSAGERYEAAKEAALGFFREAGYTVRSGKVVAAPAGASLEYQALVPGDGYGDHPSFRIFTEAQKALREIGIILDIRDLVDTSELWTGLSNQSVAIWAAAWGTAVDPDMYQIYFSGGDGYMPGGSNYQYAIDDADLNAIILEARQTTDHAARKQMYKEALDIIIDWAVEVPVYQRQNAVLFSTKNVNIGTLAPDITTYWSWTCFVENIESFSKRTDPDPIVFNDVPADAFYAEPVVWAVGRGITNGTGSGRFSPNVTCTRSQIVTFLWRANGSPEPKTRTNPFRDVRSRDYFYKAVLWAVENGVTKGTSATTFGPDDGCTRAQVVTFLWRAEGEPSAKSSGNPFRDVPAGQYFTESVLWAVDNNITKGTSSDAFSPNAVCTRGQIVTFLYRDMAGR